jgi:hypothetical protein
MIVRQSRIFVDLFQAQLNTSLVSLEAVYFQAAYLSALNKGQGAHCLPPMKYRRHRSRRRLVV